MFFGEARVPGGMRIYAIGDIHGYDGHLQRLLDEIDRELTNDSPDRYRIITLGDYCDRGPGTPAVLDLLIERQTNDPDVICLRGNHDDWMLTMLSDPNRIGTPWLTWGGRETLASYGITSIPVETDLWPLADRFAAVLPDNHRAFLEELPYLDVIGDYCFVHAGLRPGVEIEDQDREDLIWIRDPFLRHTGSLGKVVVHGHTIHDNPTILPNRIAVDTGIYVNDILTCAVLEGTDCRFIQTNGRGIAHWRP